MAEYTQHVSPDSASVSFRTKTAVVSFLSGPHGYSFVTSDVASTALERFNNEWWHGPIPTRETVLRVSLVGHDRRYRVTVERVRELGKLRGNR